MKKISDITQLNLYSYEFTESPIEGDLIREIMKRNNFVICRENDIPTGEGIFVFPQYRIGPYRADFLIRAFTYPARARIWPPKFQATVCIECDGFEFHSTPEQIEYDNIRDNYFKLHGIKTLRIMGKEIKKNVSFCVDRIANFVHSEMR